MNKLFVILAFIFSASAMAEPVGMQFRDIKIPALVDVVMRDLLKRQYVLSSDVLHLDGLVTLNVQPEREQVLDVLRNALAFANVIINDKQGVLYVEVNKNPGQPSQPSAAIGEGPPLSQRVISPGFPPRQDDASGPAVSVSGHDECGSFSPRYRTADSLNAVVRMFGTSSPDAKGIKLDSVIYCGSPDRLEKIKKLLVELDQPLRSVLVRAALIEYVDSSESQRGASVLLSILGGRFGMQVQAGNNLSNSVTLNAPNIQAVLSAIEGDSRFSSIAEPSMRVLDGELGRLVVGSEVPTRGTATISNGTTTQSVEYKTAGVVLQVEPHIQNESIVMKISQTVSDVQNTTSSGIDSPTMTKREASTTVDMTDGEIILIAGMDSNKKSFTQNGLFFLPSFLHSKNENNSKSQMMLMLEVRRNVAAKI